MITLFDSFERTCLDDKKRNEKPYPFYNKSAIPAAMVIRDTLESWFCNYPEKDKGDLKSRFQGDDFGSAFYELFVFQLFSKLGYNIVVHPELPSSSENKEPEKTKKKGETKPDFLISKDGLEIYVEAKVVEDETTEEANTRRKRNEFLDNLQKINTYGFRLCINIVFLPLQDKKNKKPNTSKQPNTNKIIKVLEKTLKMYADKINHKIDIDSNFESFEYVDEDVSIDINLACPLPGLSNVSASSGGVVTVDESLRKSIKRKVNKYGKFDKPYILCLNSISVFTSKEYVNEVIWGDNSSPLDGSIFLNKKNTPRLTNLTGILVSNVSRKNIPDAHYWLCEHPFSENKMDFKKLGLKYSYLQDNKIVDNVGDDLHEILGMPKGWLDHLI